jgi:hypothetical protein
MLRYLPYRTRTELSYSFLELIYIRYGRQRGRFRLT